MWKLSLVTVGGEPLDEVWLLLAVVTFLPKQVGALRPIIGLTTQKWKQNIDSVITELGSGLTQYKNELTLTVRDKKKVKVIVERCKTQLSNRHIFSHLNVKAVSLYYHAIVVNTFGIYSVGAHFHSKELAQARLLWKHNTCGCSEKC